MKAISQHPFAAQEQRRNHNEKSAQISDDAKLNMQEKNSIAVRSRSPRLST
jgi:hypothetical protein